MARLHLLATVITVLVLVPDRRQRYLAPVTGLGAAAAGGTVQVRIHIRR
jgi:hypothetical protein